RRRSYRTTLGVRGWAPRRVGLATDHRARRLRPPCRAFAQILVASGTTSLGTTCPSSRWRAPEAGAPASGDDLPFCAATRPIREGNVEHLLDDALVGVEVPHELLEAENRVNVWWRLWPSGAMFGPCGRLPAVALPCSPGL